MKRQKRCKGNAFHVCRSHYVNRTTVTRMRSAVSFTTLLRLSHKQRSVLLDKSSENFISSLQTMKEMGQRACANTHVHLAIHNNLKSARV